MKKRSITEYLEPANLDDLRRIVDDHADCSGQNRVWIRPAKGESGDTYYTICLSSPNQAPGA
jgi:hypothetical protein